MGGRVSSCWPVPAKKQMNKHFRTTSTLGTSNILGICVRICLKPAHLVDRLVHHTLRDATTGARCNVPPPCQRRVAGNVFLRLAWWVSRSRQLSICVK